ncbi:uncharacterized protein [Macrobrachium rosenbergii]|uniref:uncharacterized protein isoform X1 n=2 Tax=Macrobrachium rosenbergii TaxID=79674 RepID=UPI0034D6A5AB
MTCLLVFHLPLIFFFLSFSFSSLFLRLLFFPMAMAENTTDSFQPEDLEKLTRLFAEIMQSPCWNEFTSINRTEGDRKKDPSEDSMAVLYIILVLTIFGMSLLILLIKYLKKEKESAKLQRFYDDYLDKRLPSMVVHYDDEGRYLKAKTTSRKISKRPDLNLDLPSPSASSVGGTPLTSPSVMSAAASPDATSVSSNSSILKKALLEHVV